MKLMTTIVMLGLAVVNAVASPVIRDTSDAETNNDIKALTKEGKWLKPGVKGNRVTSDNGLHYARKDKEIVCSLPKEGEFLRYKELISEKNLLAMLRLARS
ncbi:hypothetical protein NHJ13734_008000 [Beauveria thailandica]